MKRSSDKNMTIFGRNLWALRRKHNLRQEDLAKAFGMPRYKISYYECRAKNPTMEFVQKVADYFKVSADDLIYDDPKKSVHPGPTSKLEQQMEQIKKLSPTKQKIISNMLDGAIKSE